jgi:hypothetical protein
MFDAKSGGIVMRYPLTVILLIVLVSLACSSCQPEGDVIFTIGEVDKSPIEFGPGDFENIRFVTIDANGDVDPKLMPRRMIHPDGHYSPDRRDAAQEVVIRFSHRRRGNQLPGNRHDVGECRRWRLWLVRSGSGLNSQGAPYLKT